MLKLPILFARLVAAAVALAAAFFAVSAPDSPRDFSAEFADLPDYDWRTFAETKWAAGDSASAMAALEFVIENRLPDSPACSRLYGEYLEQTRARNSLLGRAKAAGKGFLLGDVDGWDALAGAAVADFFVYGDLRDLARESFAGAERDGFVLAMAAFGVATSAASFAMPAGAPLDASVSLLKIAKKSGAIAPTLGGKLAAEFSAASRKISACAKLGDSAGASKAARNLASEILPVWDLAKNTKTWSEFCAVLKSADDLKMLRKINAHLKSPKNARIFERTLILDSPQARAAVGFVESGGDLRRLDFAMRKGLAGVRRVLDASAKSSRILKNAEKLRILAGASLAELFGRYGAAARFGLLAAASVLFAAAVFPISAVRGVVREFSPNETRGKKFFRVVQVFLLFAVAVFAAFAAWRVYFANGRDAAQFTATAEASYVWTIDVVIKEDRFLNETFARRTLACAVELCGDAYLVASAAALGLEWGEIPKGGVYALSVSASKRGANPASFDVDEIILPRGRAGLCLVKIPRGKIPSGCAALAPLQSATSAELKTASRFSQELGTQNKNIDVFSANGRLLCPKHSAAVGDSVILSDKFYVGMLFNDAGVFGAASAASAELSDAQIGGLVCAALPTAEDLSAAECISLKKSDGEIYFKAFCERIAALRRSGAIVPEK